MMEGTRNGVCVIPFRLDLSTLLLFSNTYPEYGISVQPTMPLNGNPLSKEEIKTLRDWIALGAPNKDGFVKFSDNTERRKIYITNQGCDLVSVFDAESSLQMRAINVGADSQTIESPHQIKVSPDGKYWYVVFYNGKYVQKYSTADDSFIGQVDLTPQGSTSGNSWNTLCISSDSKYLFAANWISKGGVAVVDLAQMKLVHYINDMIYPHGLAIDSKGSTLYVTAQSSNYITKINIADLDFPSAEKIPLQTGKTPIDQSLYDPHEVTLSPDGTKYFVTCQKTNEVRILNTAKDSLLAIIPLGQFPQEMAISTTSNYLFVSCTEDSIAAPTQTRGSVCIIDYEKNTFVSKIYGFYQPHGIGIDETSKVVFVANRNIASGGPAPHHTTVCGGKDGYLQKIDMRTLMLVEGYHSEISVDPYSIAVRK
jgi:DNA-binding beta-propeller fold protein YncE